MSLANSRNVTDADGTFSIIGQSRNEGITDGNELSKRIAGIIKELDPDVMGIQEGTFGHIQLFISDR